MFEEPGTTIAIRLAAAHREVTEARSPLATQAMLAGKELNRAVNSALAAGCKIDEVIAGALVQFVKARVEEEKREARKLASMAVRGALRRATAAVEKVEAEEVARYLDERV